MVTPTSPREGSPHIILESATIPSVACLAEMVSSFRRIAAMNHGDDDGLTRRQHHLTPTTTTMTGEENDEQQQLQLLDELLNKMHRWNNSKLARGLRYRPPPPPIGNDMIRSQDDVLRGSGDDCDNVMSNNDNKTEGDDDDADHDYASIDYNYDHHGSSQSSKRECSSNGESTEEFDDDNDNNEEEEEGTEVPGTNLSPLQYSRMNFKQRQSFESSCSNTELSNDSVVTNNIKSGESETQLLDLTSELDYRGSDEYYSETEVPGTQQHHHLVVDAAPSIPYNNKK